MNNIKRKKYLGISLIVLVITIIVIIILATTVILSISNNNPIENAKNAKDIWNRRAFEEEISVLLTSNQIDNKDLASLFRNISDFDEVITEVDSLVTVFKDDMAAIVDSKENKIVGIIDRSIVEEIEVLKKEFDERKDNITYNYKLITDESEIKNYVPSYSKEKCTLYISFRSLKKDLSDVEPFLVIEETTTMTKDKILACESNGIYLLGDTNKNYELDDGDLDLVVDLIKSQKYEELTLREEVVVNTNADDIVNSNDKPYINIRVYPKYDAYINKVKQDFETIISKEENRTNVTIKNYNEVMKYIPSHTDSDFKLWIIRGNLVCVYGDMTSYKIDRCQAKDVPLLGDLNYNDVVDSRDVNILTRYLAGTYTLEEDEVEWFNIVADINGDGTIDNKDIVELEKFIK